ncbi:hypothetical protein JXA85_04675 [Candidatus Woesearchaeota archaeon]|nr:hypothetical protein [Candidatus Woesearchaeota archaeon]
MRKMMLIFVAVLSALVLMSGCESSPSNSQVYNQQPFQENQNPNGTVVNVYVQSGDEPWEGIDRALDREGRAIGRFFRDTDKTYRGIDRTLDQMDENQRFMLGTLEGARLQDEIYRQEQEWQDDTFSEDYEF